MKAYIYCTQTKPYLVEPKELCDEQDEYGITNEDCISGIALNGSIVAECEVKEALSCTPLFGRLPFYSFGNGENRITEDDFYKRSQLDLTALINYAKGYGFYAYHLENAKPVELNLSDFYEDEACTKPLTKAPQSYRFAYRRHNCTDEEARMINKWSDQEGHECFQDVYGWYYVEKCLIFSDHPEYCAKILNGEKDLEVRKTRIAEGVEYE